MHTYNEKGIRGLSFDIKVLDTYDEINELLEQNNNFHDAEIVGINYDMKQAHISVEY